MIEKNAALKSVADQYSNALFALYKKDPFNGDGEFKTLTEFDVETTLQNNQKELQRKLFSLVLDEHLTSHTLIMVCSLLQPIVL